MFENFTDEGRRTVIKAHQIASSLGHSRVSPDHLLLALLRDSEEAAGAVQSAGGSPEPIADLIEARLVPPASSNGNPMITNEMKALLDRAVSIASASKLKAGSEHVFLALIEEQQAQRSVFEESQVDMKKLRSVLETSALHVRPAITSQSCPNCGATTREFGQVREITIDIEGGSRVNVYAYYCGRCGNTYGLVKSPQ